MAKQLVLLPATQGDRVRSSIPDVPTISVGKVALFCNPVSGARSQALQFAIKIIDKLKTCILRHGFA
jgi:hypothetical protein